MKIERISFRIYLRSLTPVRLPFSPALPGAESYLLYLAAGIYPHSAGVMRSGTLEVEGVRPDSLTPKKRCTLVGMMFQNPELQFCMDTVEHELLLPGKYLYAAGSYDGAGGEGSGIL